MTSISGEQTDPSEGAEAFARVDRAADEAEVVPAARTRRPEAFVPDPPD